jgi:hypothetical protein
MPAVIIVSKRLEYCKVGKMGRSLIQVTIVAAADLVQYVRILVSANYK